MAGHFDAHILNTATSQADRHDGAPAPEAVAVDDRSLAQLLAFAAHYGALIRFYDLENVANGDWAAFFASDPAIADALHASLDLAEIRRVANRLLAEARDAFDHPGRSKPIRRMVKLLMRLLGILDRGHLGAGPIESGLEEAVSRLLAPRRNDGLAQPIGRLKGHLAGQSIEAALGEQHSDRGLQWHRTLIDILDDLLGILFDALQSGVGAAQAAMERSLETAEHAPQSAIYNAFVQLFIDSREELNRFPRRLVDFYYDEVLDQHSLAATPDKLYLTFTRAKGAALASIPRGTLFPAGADSQGAAINYAATSSLEVTDAAVAEVSVRRVTHSQIDPTYPPIPSGVLAGSFQLDPSNPTTPTPFPMFGGDNAIQASALTMKQATLGFCIASPVLMLMGGHRTVEIGLVVSYHPLMTALVPDEPTAADTHDTMVAALCQALEGVLQLHYSTAGGWMRVDRIHVTPKSLLGSENQAVLYTIAFQLPADAPPLVPVSDKPAPGAPKPTLPAGAFPDQPQQPAVIANIDLDGNEQIPAFALLAQVQFDHIYLDVHVECLDQLTLTTPNGVADISHNFAVFGLPPAQHSALGIYAPELFVKPIDTLSVSIGWAGLPVTSTGFRGYYQNYLLDADGLVAPAPLFDNSSFRIAFSIDNPGYWDVSKGPEPYLFQTGAESSGCALPVSGIPIDSLPPAPAAPVRRTSLLDVPGIGTRTAPAYYNPATSMLKLSLASPDYAFGNILYSSNLMAASMAQTSAALDKANAGQGGGTDAQVKVAALAKVNATAPDRMYTQSVGDAVHGAVSSLTGEAIAAVQQGVAKASAPPEAKAWWLTDLESVIAAVTGGRGSLWNRLTGRGGIVSDIVGVAESVKAWIVRHEQALGESASADLGRAQGLLSAAGSVAAAHGATIDQPPAVSRPTVAAATQQAQVVVLPSPLPNPPWLPMASSLSVSYSASIDAAITEIGGAPPPPASSGSATIVPAASGDVGNPLVLDFWHIGPFGVLSTPSPEPSGGFSVLPPVLDEAALYIQLSTPVSQVSLLFILTAGKDGWWDDPPDMVWEQRLGGVWKLCKLLDDTTNGLKNSGVVMLAPVVPQGAVKAPRLRVRARGRSDNAPIVQSVIANALTAKWKGPGGAAELGIPLGAGTITKSQDKLAGVASIAQPMESFGGSPPAAGRDFQMWMAERLRHKGFAIDGWDHARIVLAAVPSLWQAAVIPAIDEKTGERAPGKVWIVAVAGPNTPNIADRTMPLVDLATLSEVGETLNHCVSSFAQVVVTNPPYLRLIVEAELEFTANDTSAFWEDRLNTELIEWLSPWQPSKALGRRPGDYYTRRAIAEFIRGRHYVLGITRLDVFPEPVSGGNGYFYLTSAIKHAITTTAPGGLELPPMSELFPERGAA